MSHYEEEGRPGETTALLANGRAGEGSYTEGPVDWKRFFFNSRSTPGTESPNRLVRYSASTWHVTKVTLLSSEFSPAARREVVERMDAWRGGRFHVLTGAQYAL